MTITNALASVAVTNVEAATAWYERLLDQPAQKPMREVSEWQFAGGGALQVYELPERAGEGSVTFAVSSIDEQADRLAQLGIDDAHIASGPRVKTVMISDPDGNHLAFAEALDPEFAR